jgi:hypothetical protein
MWTGIGIALERSMVLADHPRQVIECLPDTLLHFRDHRRFQLE